MGQPPMLVHHISPRTLRIIISKGEHYNKINLLTKEDCLPLSLERKIELLRRTQCQRQHQQSKGLE